MQIGSVLGHCEKEYKARSILQMWEILDNLSQIQARYY